MKCFMLANFAHVIFFFKNAHSTRNAGGEVTTTFAAANVKFIDDAAALGAVEFLLWLVIRWISRE